MHICQQIHHFPQPSFSKCQPCLFHPLSPPTPHCRSSFVFMINKGHNFPSNTVAVALLPNRPCLIFGTIHLTCSVLVFTVFYQVVKRSLLSSRVLKTELENICCNFLDFPQSVHCCLSEISHPIGGIKRGDKK